MRKLMHSKKGFTLVELMIVVVIMGILVAVAVPVYNAVTKNAEKKTCVSNLRIMKGNASQFYMSGTPTGDQLKLKSGTTYDITADGTYIKLFESGSLPVCPTAGTYKAEIIVDDAGIPSFNMTCTADGHVLNPEDEAES